jgi:hypothetical protein
MEVCKRIARVAAALTFVAAVVVIVVGLGWVPGADELVAGALDVKAAFEEPRELLAKGQRLDELLESEQRAAKTKNDVAAEVIAGRLTLIEAAALFTAADAELDTWSMWVRMSRIEGSSDAERQCRKVIGYVEIALADEPSACREHVHRLTAELENELQRHGGTVSLPDSESVRLREI